MLKRTLAFLLTITVFFTGCGIRGDKSNDSVNEVVVDSEDHSEDKPVEDNKAEEKYEENSKKESEKHLEIRDYTPSFERLNDSDLLPYLENSVYIDLVKNLDSEEYFVENVSAIYVSKQYYQELAYNSQKNIYFGYTLDELNEAFQGKRFVFTLGEDGTTVVQELVETDDFDPYEGVIKNVLIGSGVILLCVTVSVVTAGTGATAISVIFAASAKQAAISALTTGTFGGLSAGIITGIETGDFNQALQAAAQAGSEGFKWGAISGAIKGGADKYSSLKGLTQNGLSLNDAARIQKESNYPLDLIKQFKSMDEYEVYKNAGLRPEMIGGKMTLIRDIDVDTPIELPDGTFTDNYKLMSNGYAPVDPLTGKKYQLHHVNQNMNGTLAILTEEEHQGNSAILNIMGKESEIDRPAFDKIRKQFWKDFASQIVR